MDKRDVIEELDDQIRRRNIELDKRKMDTDRDAVRFGRELEKLKIARDIIQKSWWW